MQLFELAADAPHLEEALTHPSYANEQAVAHDNQRLEFIGDAVLGFCTSDLLFARYPEANEGTLTRLRAHLVNAEALASWAREVDIAGALLLGKGADAAGLRASTNVLADAVEALIAATFFDTGLEAARRVCNSIIDRPLAELAREAALSDAKSTLQERVQGCGKPAPTYQVLHSGGPAHARWFEVGVQVNGALAATGRGRSKRQAEQAAAEAALAGPWAPVAEQGEADPRSEG